MPWRRNSEHQMTRYWGSGISVTPAGAYEWNYYDSCRTLDEAIAAIDESRVRGDVVCAWVKDDAGELCYHASYLDAIGNIIIPGKEKL